MHGQFNEVIRQVAAEQGVYLIGLARDMADPKFFYDFVHLNNYGSTQVARYITYHLMVLLK